MRFIPTTHMQSGDVCVAVNSNGGVSGSFTSGSETWNYHEYSSSARTVNDTFQFELTKGFTRRMRVILIGGGGAGGNNGTGGVYNSGGGGGAGAVNIFNDVQTFAGNLYTITVGRGGERPDPGHTTPTYNGGDGGYSRFTDNNLILNADGGDGGHGNSTPFLDTDGGDSGNNFTGGSDATVNRGGGGAGSTANGGNADGSLNEGGDGGAGQTINLPYTSPTFGTANINVGGGGGGGIIGSTIEGTATDGGGRGAADTNTSDSGDRYTGGGGGGGDENASQTYGSYGGDGCVIILYPTGSC